MLGLIRYRSIVLAGIAGFCLLGLGLDVLAPTPRSATARLEYAPGSAPPAFGTFHIEGAAVHVEPVPGTRLTDLRVEHPVPEVALTIARRVARDYTEGRRPAGGARLAALEARSRAVEADQGAVMTRLGAIHAFLREISPDWSHLDVHDGRLGQRRAQVLHAAAELEAARRVYRDRHPRRVALDRRLAELDVDAWEELERALIAGNAQQKQLAEREIALRAAIVQEQELDSPATKGPPRATVVAQATVTPWTFRPTGVFALCAYLLAGLLAGASTAVALESHRDLAEALTGGAA